MIENLFSFGDSLLFFCSFLSVVYLFVFAVASMCSRTNRYPEAKNQHRYVLLAPFGTTLSAQQYPEELYRIQCYDNLSEAIQTLDETKHDMVIVLGEGSRISPFLLQEVNNAYDAGITALQLHSVIDPITTRQFHLQAINEEISNAVFQQGHTQLGLSSAFIGMDIALDLKWIKKNLKSEKSNLERKLLRQNIFIDYLNEPPVYSPIAHPSTHTIKRRKALYDLPEAFFSGHWDYVGKLVQQLIPSWTVLLPIIALVAVVATYYEGLLSVKWWILLFGLLFTLSLAIPDYLVTEKKKKKFKIIKRWTLPR
ncbi:MAG: hypothetical protein RR365_09840 [Bacteroides sp.]